MSLGFCIMSIIGNVNHEKCEFFSIKLIIVCLIQAFYSNLYEEIFDCDKCFTLIDCFFPSQWCTYTFHYTQASEIRITKKLPSMSGVIVQISMIIDYI